MTTIDQIRQMLAMADIQPCGYQFRIRLPSSDDYTGWIDLLPAEYAALQQYESHGEFQFRTLYCFEEGES